MSNIKALEHKSLAMRGPFAVLRRHWRSLLGWALLFTFCRQPMLCGWDDSYYITQLTSAVADRDLMLQNDLLAFPNGVAGKLRALTFVRPSGALWNGFSIGPALMHSFYAWPLLVNTARPIGPPLRAALAIGGLVFLILTVRAMRALVLRFGFGRGEANVASVGAVVFGPLALYATRLTFNSHLLGALLVTFLLIGALRWMETGSRSDALAFGIVAGLIAVNRWQDVLIPLAIVPVLLYVAARQDRRGRWWDLALAAVGAAVPVFVQLRVWRVIFGHWMLVPQGGDYLHWNGAGLVPFLISSYHGLVPWTPGFALGLLGWVSLARERNRPQRWILVGLTLFLPIFFYISSTPFDWWGGSAYGPRRLSSLTPLAAVGLAAVLRHLHARVRVGVLAALALWAVLTSSAFIPGGDDLTTCLLGRRDPFRPPDVTLAGTCPVGVVDWLRVLRPGFSFSDRPHTLDRALGALSVAAVLTVVNVTWSGLRRSRRGQKAAVGVVFGWLVVAAIWVAGVIPDNRTWDTSWAAVLRGEPPREGLPARVWDAAHVVVAAAAVRRGDGEQARIELRQLSDPAYYGVDLDTLTRAVSEAPP